MQAEAPKLVLTVNGFADLCAPGQACNAVGPAVGQCVNAIAPGVTCAPAVAADTGAGTPAKAAGELPE